MDSTESQPEDLYLHGKAWAERLDREHPGWYLLLWGLAYGGFRHGGQVHRLSPDGERQARELVASDPDAARYYHALVTERRLAWTRPTDVTSEETR